MSKTIGILCFGIILCAMGMTVPAQAMIMGCDPCIRECMRAEHLSEAMCKNTTCRVSCRPNVSG